MISSPSRSTSGHGKLCAENENAPLSPKRSFAQLDENPLSQPELKRRDVQPSRRAPLNPLSASHLENRLARVPHSTDAASHHALVTPHSDTDIPSPHPTQPASSGTTSDALVRAWPPSHPTSGTVSSSPIGQAGQQPSQRGSSHRPDEKLMSHATFPEPTSTWDPSTSCSAEPTMTKPMPITGWNPNVLQPIRPRTTSMPSIRRPPSELWQSNSPPTKLSPVPVDIVDSLVHPAPPGLPPRRPELRRSGSTSDLLPHGSVSLSLAFGSQPLSASEHAKAVPPIGAERSRVISITSLKAHSLSPPSPSHDHSISPWCSSTLPSSLQTKWTNETYFSNVKSLERVRATAGSASKEDLERLLHHAVRNKHAPKVVSPLSPLRTSTLAPNLASDPEFQLRMPSRFNTPSSRYSYCPPKRARTTCDGYQTCDWDVTCMHCQECKRDGIAKRLLAFRFRQQQTRHAQRSKLFMSPSREAITSVTDDDCIVLANRIRDVFAYELDEEEKGLWAEVATVTGARPVPFSRLGPPCATAATHRRVVVGREDGARDDLFELMNAGLLARESTTLFREASAY